MPPPARPIQLQPALGILGAILLFLTFILTLRGAAFFATHTYELAWWSLIAALDGFVWWRTRRSPIAEAPFRFLLLCLWSVSLWFAFELFNLRLRNWYYVFVSAGAVERWTGSFLAFATVIPGIVLFAEALDALGLFRRLPGVGRELPLPRLLPPALVALGVSFMVLPMIWPRYCYPLVWGGLVLILDPLNRRFGGGSILAQLAVRAPRVIVNYLCAGAAAGFFWEILNYWARVKWIYTVPPFEEWKLFEMPLLGFLGFPPFALECWVVVESLSVAGLLPAPRVRSGPVRGAALLAAALIPSLGFAAGALHGMERLTFASLYPLVEDLPGLGDSRREDLRRRGIGDCFSLREAVSRSGEDRSLEERLDLVLLAGIGIEKALALEGLGIRSVGDLARADPAEVSSKIERLDLRHLPTRAEVRYWVREARRSLAAKDQDR
jgi:hypothetical protein